MRRESGTTSPGGRTGSRQPATRDSPFAPPLIGALLRTPWQLVRDRMLLELHEAGYTDIVAAHLTVLQYPGPEGRRPSDLASETRMSKQATNYLLGQMERLGYLERQEDEADQRSKRIRLTARGRAAGKTIRRTVSQIEAEWEEELGSAEFGRLRELLIALVGIAAADRSSAARSAAAETG